MQLRATLVVLCLTLPLLPTALRAGQACPERGEDGLPFALERHRSALKALMLERNLVAPEARMPKILAAIGKNLGLTPQHEKVLIYVQEDSRFCAYVLDEGGLIGYAARDQSAAVLTKLQDDLRADLGVSAREAARAGAPRLYGQSRAAVPLSLPRKVNPTAALEAMSVALLLPDLLGALAGADEVIVVPVDGIGTVPLALLPIGDKMVLDLAPVTIAPSILALAGEDALKAEPEPGAPGPVGFSQNWQGAVVVGDPDASRDADWAFPPLPGARAEAQAMARSFAISALIGPEATVDAVLAALARPVDLIYVAAHAVASQDAPLTDSFIALTGGRLTAEMVQVLHLPNNPLVVLSACQTGLGKAHAGGIIGLSRGFLIAGASAVVVSLWSVDDAATAVLMTDFAAALRGHRPAEALRQAMMAGRARYDDDPALWAGFSYQGGISAAIGG